MIPQRWAVGVGRNTRSSERGSFLQYGGTCRQIQKHKVLDAEFIITMPPSHPTFEQDTVSYQSLLRALSVTQSSGSGFSGCVLNQYRSIQTERTSVAPENPTPSCSRSRKHRLGARLPYVKRVGHAILSGRGPGILAQFELKC